MHKCMKLCVCCGVGGEGPFYVRVCVVRVSGMLRLHQPLSQHCENIQKFLWAFHTTTIVHIMVMKAFVS